MPPASDALALQVAENPFVEGGLRLVVTGARINN
jgi:hypothetical protein